MDRAIRLISDCGVIGSELPEVILCLDNDLRRGMGQTYSAPNAGRAELCITVRHLESTSKYKAKRPAIKEVDGLMILFVDFVFYSKDFTNLKGVMAISHFILSKVRAVLLDEEVVRMIDRKQGSFDSQAKAIEYLIECYSDFLS